MNSYKQIANYYSQAFEQHGATPQGLAWDNQENLNKRYEVMYDLINPKEISHIMNSTLLDFGCGYGGFYKWLLQNKNYSPSYSGIDINENLILKARESYPEVPFGLVDIHSEEGWEVFNNPRICSESYNYCIINGVFTVRRGLNQNEMWDFMTATIIKLWDKTTKGLAFNCMSKILDFEREDLYHVSFDKLGEWIYKELKCSNFLYRQDYQLREFTTYLYK